MSAEFDPYYKWLGIPPAEQPPNHYRLLGIQLCEPDLDVISNAADQRMAHIRTFQSGKYSQVSQRILNEISTARVLLLSPTKEQYDRNLRSSIASTDAQPAQKPLPKAKPLATRRSEVPLAEPRSSDDANPFDTIVNVSQPTHDVPQRKPAKPSWQNPVLLGVAGVLILLVLCAIVYVLVSSPSANNVALQPELPAHPDSPTQREPTDSRENLDAVPADPQVSSSADRTPYEPEQPPEEIAVKPPVDDVVQQPNVESPEIRPDSPSTVEFEVEPPDTGSLVYLDDLMESDFRVGYGTLGKHGLQGYQEREAVFKGISLVHALSMHGVPNGSAYATYALDGRMKTFQATVGVLDLGGGQPASPLTFKVVGDGTVLWTSQPIDKRSVGQDCKVSIQGVRVLVLQVECPGPHDQARAVWVDPRISRVELESSKRLVPNADEQARAEQPINELFKDDIAAAKSDDDKLALAKTWIQSGNETKDDDAARYVLLQMAARTAVHCGDIETAMAAIDGMDSYFEVDAWNLRSSALSNISKARGTDFRERNQQVADSASGLIDDAISEGEFKPAEELLNIALASARNAKDVSLVKELVVRKKEIDELAKVYQAAMEAFATLENNPADPNANLIAGRYLCFVKGDWAKGLPFLAKGDNDELKSVVRMELAAPTTPAQRSAVGDAWWDVAESADDAAKKHLFVRATDWYRAALPNLTGLDKTKVEQRLAEVTKRFGEGTKKSAKFVGVVIDVLAEVDIERDRIQGEWSMRDDGLCMHKGQRAKLPLPVIPTGDFELTVEFTLLDKNQIGFIFPLNPSTAVFWTDGAYEGYQLTNNPDGGQYILKKKPLMPLFGGRRKLYLKVTKTADELYNISIALQGEPIIAWKGPASELFKKPGYELPFDAISMSNWDAGAVFHSIKLRPLSGDVLRIMHSKAAIGNWNIKYADGARRTYRFDENGSVFFVEVNRRGRLLRARNGDVLLDFNDGKRERLHLAGNTMRVEHFDPAGSYPKIVKLTAIGQRSGN